MDSTTLAWLVLSIMIAMCVIGFLAYVIWWVNPLHRVRYKVWTLPCPACRDDETDEPNGYITPDNPRARLAARSVTESGKLPSFECTTCDGTKKVHYEFPRSRPPKINERNMVVGPIHKEVKKGQWFG